MVPLQEAVEELRSIEGEQGAGMERMQGMITEVVQVIGAMSAKMSQEEEPGRRRTGRVDEQVEDRLQEMHKVYEKRFHDIAVMIRHIGMSGGGKEMLLSTLRKGREEEESETESGESGAGGRSQSLARMLEEMRRIKVMEE